MAFAPSVASPRRKAAVSSVPQPDDATVQRSHVEASIPPQVPPLALRPEQPVPPPVFFPRRRPRSLLDFAIVPLHSRHADGAPVVVRLEPSLGCGYFGQVAISRMRDGGDIAPWRRRRCRFRLVCRRGVNRRRWRRRGGGERGREESGPEGPNPEAERRRSDGDCQRPRRAAGDDGAGEGDELENHRVERHLEQVHFGKAIWFGLAWLGEEERSKYIAKGQ